MSAQTPQFASDRPRNGCSIRRRDGHDKRNARLAWRRYPIPAQAQDDGVPKGQGGPTGEHGQRGSKTPSEVGGRGQGQGGPSGDSDAKGPRYGGEGSKPAAGTQGGKPVWAQEGVPSDLELGRLSVVRAPSHVIDQSLASALAALQPAFYDQVVAIANNARSTKRTRSPRCRR